MTEPCVCPSVTVQLFELVEENPIAAASIGQVYKAKLRSTGEVVAVKVGMVIYSRRSS